MSNTKISIITATFNAVTDLPRLIESLVNQVDKDFEWVVADGGSTDGSLSLLESLKGINLKLSIEKDFGIYDALNRAIVQSQADYYLILGADDYLYPDAIQRYRMACNIGSPDIISANVETDKGLLKPNQGKPYLRGQLAFVSQHSVGTLIKKSLHERFGYYSRRFPIAADQYFVKQVCIAPGSSIKYADFVAGFYPTNGTSGIDLAGSMTEFFRVQLETERYPLIQLILFLLRLLKHFPKLIKYSQSRNKRI
jgi:glycosyltransferase involved in cell wall biosynthesis